MQPFKLVRTSGSYSSVFSSKSYSAGVVAKVAIRRALAGGNGGAVPVIFDSGASRPSRPELMNLYLDRT